MKQFDVPILILIFNRPETEKKVFEVIRKIKPKVLYVAADGPRKNIKGETKRCYEARKIIDQGIDWKCKIHKLYRNDNLGCKIAVTSAIDWFFENVKEGIILEDDCSPDITFFNYCSVLLKKYRNNSKVMHIGGNNFQNGIHRGESEASYYFSKYPHIWGWATWRRAWGKYSLKINMLAKNFWGAFYKMNLSEKIYWGGLFWNVNHGLVDTWDYQWLYTCWENKGLAILPNRNLVVNIGFGKYATNTKRSNNFIDSIELSEITTIKHPKHILIDSEADLYTSDNVYGINKSLSKNLITISHFVYKYLSSFFKQH